MLTPENTSENVSDYGRMKLYQRECERLRAKVAALEERCEQADRLLDEYRDWLAAEKVKVAEQAREIERLRRIEAARALQTDCHTGDV